MPDLYDRTAGVNRALNPIPGLFRVARHARHDRGIIEHARVLLRQRERLADLFPSARTVLDARETHGEPGAGRRVTGIDLQIGTREADRAFVGDARPPSL